MGKAPAAAGSPVQNACFGLADPLRLVLRTQPRSVNSFFILHSSFCLSSTARRLICSGTGKRIVTLKTNDSTPRILIVDDQPDVLEALRLLLKGEGYRIDTAHSPGRAMGLLEKRSSWPALRANARDFVERERTWRGSVGRYQRVYEELCAAGAH